ncbi:MULTISPECIES: DUF2917 domain-containing protein [unclassified Herbaspirillum]|uniref:DUF2917 domain-containing protein n=1 Tax=unclassified Herbaspirillum TaxID=2624150 RepID=UPI001153418A|nr:MULTISPECIES: DUF2917 domain-containing protein [unclassified Herbaspirillum]MBB5390854.1 hypothetical protein [Herbaspirillum sp. SJZ102]TQK06380.1 DUF2917 family protein [Herbaspirillum sp. SJZ130]TQK12142.1 DUF2917 family protein [Herbaspirillum sp. SJZ106]
MNRHGNRTPSQWLLQRRQVRATRVAQVCTLEVSHGRVWVTQEGRADDFWLESGHSMVLLPGALVVIEADHMSSLRIEPVLMQTARAWLHLCCAGARGLAAALGGKFRHNASTLLGNGEGR